MRRVGALMLFVLLVAVPSASAATVRQVALQRLASLRVATPLPLHGFSPARFPHWRDPDRNGCDAREDLLIRTGTHVRRGRHCVIRSGIWHDAYSGAVLHGPGRLVVDHLVPLANAWRSGARHWTRARRTRYANDPVVLAVAGRRLDRQKGALPPDRWKPPRRSAWFGYAVRWIRIKAKYRLTVTPPERSALRVMLDLPPANTLAPAITGRATVGSTLTVTTGRWRGAPAPVLRRQWQRCTATGCLPIPAATGPRYSPVTADAGRRLRVLVTAANRAGRAVAVSAATAVIRIPPPSAADPHIAAAGDIACDPTSVTFHNGAGTPTSCAMRVVSNLMIGHRFAAVLPLGDTQYACGGLSAYRQSYDLSWGRLLAVSHPVVGNHEYLPSGGTDCDPTGNAGGYFSYFGSRAGTRRQGYYSFDVGAWHLIALNSSCSAVGGCGPTSPQGRWLAADLAAHRTTCTLAYWHIPLFSSGGRAAIGSQPLWQQLYNAGADVILDGHDHIYERFAPQTPGGVRDDARGIRQFIVGTGGADHTALVSVAANSQVRNTTTFGILELTLHGSSYDWRFVPAPGTGTFTDAGSQACH